MFIAYGYAELHLPYSHSLKEKRGIVHGVSERIRKRFNVSLAEVDHQDLWQRCRLGFSAVSYDITAIEIIVKSIRESLDNYSDQLEVLDFEYRVNSYSRSDRLP